MNETSGQSRQVNPTTDLTSLSQKEPTLVPSTTPATSRLIRWLEWIFSYEPSYLPLFVLWCLGVIWAVFEMMRSLPTLIKPDEAGVLTDALRILVTIQLVLGFGH